MLRGHPGSVDGFSLPLDVAKLPSRKRRSALPHALHPLQSHQVPVGSGSRSGACPGCEVADTPLAPVIEALFCTPSPPSAEHDVDEDTPSTLVSPTLQCVKDEPESRKY